MTLKTILDERYYHNSQVAAVSRFVNYSYSIATDDLEISLDFDFILINPNVLIYPTQYNSI